ncbi:hypothetical protein AB1E18_017511 [Capra hircus]
MGQSCRKDVASSERAAQFRDPRLLARSWRGLGQHEHKTTQRCFLALRFKKMSADDRGIRATQNKERARETPGHGHSCQEMLSESEGPVPLGEARESPRIKVEPEEPHPEGVLPETRAQGARGWVPLSQGAKEKVCFLPGGAPPAPQIPVLSREGRTRDRQMATALLTAWSQMPVTFEDVALYLSREEWGRLDHTQQSFYREVLQKRSGLSLGFPFNRPFWASQVQGKGEAPGSSRQLGREEEKRGVVEADKEELAASLGALGDAKAFKSPSCRVGRAQGEAPRCGQRAASGQNSGPAKDNVQPCPVEEAQPESAPPDTDLPKTQEGHFPEQPREGETAAPESSEEGLALDSEAEGAAHRLEVRRGKPGASLQLPAPPPLISGQARLLGPWRGSCRVRAPDCRVLLSDSGVPVQMPALLPLGGPLGD